MDVRPTKGCRRRRPSPWVWSSENWFNGEPVQSGAVLLGSWTRCGTTVSFLGVKGKTGEIVIGARSGIFKARDCQEEVDRGSLEPEGHGARHRRTVEDDDKVDGEKFAKLQVTEGAIRKYDEDVKKGERWPPKVNELRDVGADEVGGKKGQGFDQGVWRDIQRHGEGRDRRLDHAPGCPGARVPVDRGTSWTTTR